MLIKECSIKQTFNSTLKKKPKYLINLGKEKLNEWRQVQVQCMRMSLCEVMQGVPKIKTNSLTLFSKVSKTYKLMDISALPQKFLKCVWNDTGRWVFQVETKPTSDFRYPTPVNRLLFRRLNFITLCFIFRVLSILRRL